MMMALLLLKSKLKNFYEAHYRNVRGVWKMVFVFGALLIVTKQLHFADFYGGYLFLLLLAILCGVTPDIISGIVVCFVSCWQIFHVSALLAVSIVVILVIYQLLFGRLAKKQFFVIFSIPILSVIHISYVVPLVAALFVTPVVLPAVLMGVLLQYMWQGVVEYEAAVGMTDTDNIVSSLQYLAHYLAGSRMMYITMIAFALTFLCVYWIRKSQAKHSSQISILVGAILLMTVELLCNIMMELQMATGYLTLQVVISVVIAYVIQFFRISLDYHGTKKLQFEDDEYYYYVTAVPKFKVAVVDRTVTRIISEKEEE